MSIFVEKSDNFEVTVKWVARGSKVEIVPLVPVVTPVSAEPVGGTAVSAVVPGEVVPPASPAVDPEGTQTLTCTVRRPNFADVQTLIAASKERNEFGRMDVDPGLLQNAALYTLLASWDVKGVDDKPVKVNRENINRLRPEVSRALIEGIFAELGTI